MTVWTFLILLVLSVVRRILCFWTLYKPQGFGPKSQGFFQLIFKISRFQGCRGWKVCELMEQWRKIQSLDLKLIKATFHLFHKISQSFYSKWEFMVSYRVLKIMNFSIDQQPHLVQQILLTHRWHCKYLFLCDYYLFPLQLSWVLQRDFL